VGGDKEAIMIVIQNGNQGERWSTGAEVKKPAKRVGMMRIEKDVKGAIVPGNYLKILRSPTKNKMRFFTG
jgi:hypothetical protein